MLNRTISISSQIQRALCTPDTSQTQRGHGSLRASRQTTLQLLLLVFTLHFSPRSDFPTELSSRRAVTDHSLETKPILFSASVTRNVKGSRRKGMGWKQSRGHQRARCPAPCPPPAHTSGGRDPQRQSSYVFAKGTHTKRARYSKYFRQTHFFKINTETNKSKCVDLQTIFC